MARRLNLIAREFPAAPTGTVKRKKNITGDLHYRIARDKARRVCSYSPEVMVRITSYGKGEGNARSNMGYISRIDVTDKEDLALETDRGEILDSREAIKEYAEGWQHDFGKPNKNRRDTMRLMLSMPPGTHPEAVKNATREFARATFGGNHEYVFVLHTDEPHPHCHLLVKMLGHDGRRLDPGRDDLADWREVFAREMRAQGVDAEATRRAARGVVRKAEKSVVRHMENDGRVPKVVALRELDAIAALKAEHQGQQVAPTPWEAPIRSQQDAVRSAWLAAADALEQGPPALAFLPEDHHARLQGVQAHAAAYQAGLNVRPSVDPRKAPPHRSMRTAASIPTRAHLGAVGTGKRAGAVIHPVAFLPEDHHEQIKHTQQHGAAYQARLASPRTGEPPRQVTALATLPRLDPAGYGMPLQWRRPLTIGSVAGMPTLASLHAPGAGAGPARIPPPLAFTQEIQHERPTRNQYAAAIYQSHLATPRRPLSRSTPSLRDMPRVDVVRRTGSAGRTAQMLLQQDARYFMGLLAGTDHAMRWAGAGPAGARPGAGRQGGTQGRGGTTAGGTGSRPESANEARQGAAARYASKPSYRSIGTVAGILTLPDAVGTAGADRALAADIRSFVANMPPIETTRDVLKRQLAARFTLPAQAVPAQAAPQAVPSAKPQPAPASSPESGQQKGAEPSAPE